MRVHLCLSAAVVAAASAACTIGELPSAPSVIQAPSVAPVPTQVPGVWDSREELAAWVSNGVSTGPATVVGDGPEAVIRIDLAAGETFLHGPSIDAPDNHVGSAELRCRWRGRVSTDLLFITMHLRPVVSTARDLDLIETLWPAWVSSTKGPLIFEATGEWVDQRMLSSAPRPGTDVTFVTMLIGAGTANMMPRPGTSPHGVLEIDRIRLNRE